MSMSRSLTIGSKPDNDLVLNVPSVSGHHCRISREANGYILEDLASTNGTYFNGERIYGRTKIALGPTDTIHLGSHALAALQVLSKIGQEPTPTVTLRGSEMVIGRNASCDQVIDQAMISSRHARLFRSGDRVLIEDLGSSNGTFVNGNRIQQPVVVDGGDVIGLGSYTFILDTGAWRQKDTILAAPATASTESSIPAYEFASGESTIVAAQDTRPALESVASHPWRLVALIAQAPLVALLIVAINGTSSPAPITFWIALAAVWFGLSNAVLSNVVELPRPRTGLSPAGASSLLIPLLVVASLCLFQCVLTWVIVAAMASLKAPGISAIALLILAAAAGLALGLLLLAVTPRREVAWAILPVALLVLWLFGGQWQPLATMPAPAALISSVVPTRWAFEGLLLLESDQRPGDAGAAVAEPASDQDLAESYFPADTVRMGVKADAMALFFMFIGIAAAAAFISTASKPPR
jgi:pSer/pThr/pTyr-binding forkhead associated (FHA) protein